MCLATYGQNFDKELLIGKWRAIGMKMNELEINRRDIGLSLRSAKAMAKKEGATDEQVAAMDSAELMIQLGGIFKDMEGSYMEFEKDGTMRGKLGLGNPDAEELEGKYEWVGGNKILSTGSEEKDKFLIVTQLTKNKFAFKPSEKMDDGTEVQLIFERE